MKKKILVLLIFMLGLTLCSCKKVKVDETSTNDTPPVEEQSIRELYDELLLYQERLEELTKDSEEVAYNNDHPISKLSTNEYDTYTRDELLERYYLCEHDIVEENYMEHLLTAKVFVTNIKENITDDLDQEVGVEFQPNPGNDNMIYKFLYGEEGYIVIDVKLDIHHHIVKIGMNEDKLEYIQLHYSYSNEFDPVNNPELMFNYFKFEEDNEAVYINSLEGSYDLNYTSILSNKNFTISYGRNRIEIEDEENSVGYVLNYYNPETNSRANLQVIENVIMSETYDVFSDYGLLYRYTHNDKRLDTIKLTVNFIEATGWDHIIVASNNGGNPGELDGIYDSNDNPIYQGRIRLTYTPSYAYAAIDQVISKEELSDAHFALENYGLELNEPKMNLNAFRDVQIESFTELKEELLIDGLNFFANDLTNELYNFLDQDIINSIEGNNDPGNVNTPTGDVEEFEIYMNAFNQEFQNNPVMYLSETGKIEYHYDNGTQPTYSEFFISENIDLNEFYYSARSLEGGYFLLNESNRLIGFQKDGDIVDYETVYDTASIENFEDFLSKNTTLYDSLKGVISVTKQSEYEFDVELSYEALGLTTELYLSQKNINGLHDATIHATFTFSEDTTAYNYTIKIDGLSHYKWGKADVIHTSSGIVEITTNQKYDLLNREGNYFYLPQDIDEIIFESPYDYSKRYYLHDGTSYMLMYLNPGTFEVGINESIGDTQIEVEDLNGNMISDTEVLTIKNEGYYIIKIYSPFKQSVDIAVKTHWVPIVHEIMLNDISGVFNQTFVDGEYYKIHVPSSEEPRLLAITLNVDLINSLYDGIFDIHSEPFEASSSKGCMFFEEFDTQTCYFFFTPGTEYVLNISTHGVESVALPYEFIELPIVDNGVEEITITNLQDIHTVILSENRRTVRVNFTIYEETTYDIISIPIYFGHPAFKTALYDSEWNLIDEYIENFRYTFQPGDYYIIYTLKEENNPVIFEIKFE